MNLEISKEELGYLLDLVDSRVSELHPEIRRSMEHEFKDKLKHELACMQGLLQRLKSCDGGSP
jgi:hypothetical protein